MHLFSILIVFLLTISAGCEYFRPYPASNSMQAESCDCPDLTFRKAAECAAETLAVAGEKVCIGTIETEVNYQMPIVSAFLDELEFSIANRMEILERKRLQEIIAQHKLQSSDFFNQKEMVELSKFAKVGYMLVGRIREASTSYEVQLKMISMETALIKRAARIGISKDKVPAHIVREMAKMELASRGYQELNKGSQGEVLSYFQHGYRTQKVEEPLKPLEVHVTARKKVKEEVTPFQNGDILREDDKYQFQIKVIQNTHVYAIQVDSTGKVYPIFPVTAPKLGYKYNFSNPLEPGKTYIFPPPEGDRERWFTVKKDEGLGQVGLLVSPQPLPSLEKLLHNLSDGEKQESVAIQEPILIREIEGIKRFAKSKNYKETTVPTVQSVQPEKKEDTVVLKGLENPVEYPLWFYGQ